MLARILISGIVADILLAGYGFMAYPLSGGTGVEDILLEGLLVMVIFLYLFAAIFGTREYDRVDRWVHRQGVVFGLAAGVLAIGMIVNGSLGDTPVFNSHGIQSARMFQWIGIFLVTVILVMLGAAAVNAAKKTGEVTAGVQVGLWGALIASLIAFAAISLISYLFTGALEQSPTNMNDFAASGQSNMIAFLIKEARVSGTILLAVGLPVGAGLGALGGLTGRALARARRA
jgi:hypothetical protein